MTVTLPPLPPRLAALPQDERGYPVPWFTEWVKEGKRVEPRAPGAEPDFRAMSEERRRQAVRDELCWICGRPLFAHRVFAVGPMCVINLVSSEPPSHRDCAEFAVKACPFLARPRMRRLPKGDLADNYGDLGIMLEHNPGVTALVEARAYEPFDSGNGWLLRIIRPQRVDWWAQGRLAFRDEVIEALLRGYPTLEKIASDEGPSALAELERARAAAMKFMPA